MIGAGTGDSDQQEYRVNRFVHKSLVFGVNWLCRRLGFTRY